MKIKSKIMLGVSLFAMTFSFEATAQTCKTMPTCAELGYTATSCSGDSLKCPFDTSKLYCVKARTLCTPGKIFYTDGTCSDDYDSSKTVLGVVVNLNATGSYLVIDITNSSSAMNLTAAQSYCASIVRNGIKARVIGDLGVTYDGNQVEYRLINNSISRIQQGLAKIPNATQLSTSITVANYSSDTYFIRSLSDITGTGSSKSSGPVRCVFDVMIDEGGNICTWSGTLDSCPTGCNCSQDTCGGVTKYTITSAQSGYTVSGSTCVANTCSGYDSSSSSIANCSSVSSCTKPTGTVYKCASCNSGYYVSGGTCVANTCSGYNYSSASISYCSYVSSCTKPTGTVYKCASCYGGYSVNSSGGCTVSCSYTLTTPPTIAHCASYYSCTKNGTTYYGRTCKSCEAGYCDTQDGRGNRWCGECADAGGW